jgi:hypothetical protein
MLQIGVLIVVLVLVLLLFVREVIARVNKNRFIEGLNEEEDVNNEIKKRLLKYLVLFGLTITSGMSFIGTLLLISSFTYISKSSGQSFSDFLLYIIVVIIIILGILGTVGLIKLYKKI